MRSATAGRGGASGGVSAVSAVRLAALVSCTIASMPSFTCARNARQSAREGRGACKGNGRGRGATGVGWGTSATMREEVELGEELAQGMHDDFELGCVCSDLGQER